jgi:hypothetical protein
VIATVLIVVAGQAWQGRSPGGPSATESRDRLNGVLVDTFSRLGTEPEREARDRGPLTCGLPGGAEGESYFLDKFAGPAPDDIERAVADVRAMWEGLGFEVSERDIAPVLVLSARTPDGGGVYLFVGPDEVTGDGESACGVATDHDAD